MKLTDLNPSFRKDEEGMAGFLVFTCPTNPDVRVDIPVSFKDDPHAWRIDSNDFSRLTVSPSIWIRWQHDHPGAHFFIKEGNIKMA